MKFTTTFYSILFFGHLFYAQTTAEKVDTIIKKSNLVETKIQGINFTLESIQPRLLEEDSIELNELNQSITVEKIHANFKNSFLEDYTESEINDIYQFFTSNAFRKLYEDEGINRLLYKGFTEINDRLTELYLKIENRDKVEDSIQYFEPIFVDRKDGFYAVPKQDEKDKRKVELVNEPAITFDDIQSAELDYDLMGRKVLNIKFNKNGTKLLRQLTTRHVGEPIAIVFDHKIIGMPMVNEPIPAGNARISLNFDEELIQKLLEKLPMPNEVEFEF